VNLARSLAVSGAWALIVGAAGCGQQGPAQPANDVRRAASDAAKAEAEEIMFAADKAADDRRHLAAAQSSAGTNSDNATRNAALATAQAAHREALKLCASKTGDEQEQCTRRADAEYVNAEARSNASVGVPGPKA
jgi:hypothetical protein